MLYNIGKTLKVAILLQSFVAPHVLSKTSDFLGERGAFRVQFTAGELFSESQAREYADYLSMEEVITWELFVAEKYDPERPAGVLTYVSPTRSGRTPEEWKTTLGQHNLIWISANKSGNGAGRLIRSIYAILGTELVRKSYAVDDERLYISGFSGGGRMASILMHRFGHFYKGAVYICGVNFWDDLPRRNKEIMRQRRHVFLTGTKDFNYRDTTNALKLYREAGLRHYELMVIKDMGHRLPDASDLSSAIRFLDSDN